VTDDIVIILRDWGTRDLKSRIVETLLRNAADEIELLRTTVDESTAALSRTVTALMCKVDDNNLLRAMIQEYVSAETASWPPDDMETYARWERRAGDAWDVLVEQARHE
jgi:hypothetical protein